MGNRVAGEWGYLIVWEFRVRTGMEKRFEAAYGSDGAWARLFQKAKGYVGTELNRDTQDPQRFVTLDFWMSRGAYETFREQHLAEYKTIDERCAAMTENEAEVGKFERASPEQFGS